MPKSDITIRFELEIEGKIYSAEKTISHDDASSPFALDMFVGSFMKNIERNTYKTLSQYGYERFGLE